MIGKVILYTIFMYGYLIIIIRLMGKREVGSLSIFDLAVYFTISDLITISIIDHTVPIYHAIISVSLLAIMQIILSKITLKSKKIRDFIDGKGVIIINNGKIDFQQMKKQRYSLDDLYSQLREQGYEAINQVKWAILENSGKLSILPYDSTINAFPFPIIIDGMIDYDSLKKINKDEKWLHEAINEANIKNIKEIKLALFINNKLIFTFQSFK